MSTPSGMSSTPSALQDLADLARGPPEQAGVGRDGAAQADHPGVDVLLGQPRAVQAVVLGRRPEVPDVRAAAARLERVARHLVARPLADVGARDVADVVEVEQQHRAEVGGVERGPGAAEAVRPEAVGVDPLLPVDGHRSRRRERPHPDPSLQARRDTGAIAPFTNATQPMERAQPGGNTRQVAMDRPTASEGERVGLERRSGATEPEYADMGDRLRQARRARGLSLRRPGRGRGRVAEPHLPGRDRARQAVGQHAVRARDGARRSRSTSSCSWTPSRRPRTARARRSAARWRPRSPHVPVQRATSRSTIRLGSGRRLGAADDRVDPQRGLPPRDLRGRRRVAARPTPSSGTPARSGATS